MKAADISDEAFMVAVAETPPMHPGYSCWRHRRDVQATLERSLGFEIPEKLFLAKAKKLGQRQKLEGCTRCSCRGDYHLPRECRLHNCCYAAGYDWTTHPGYDPAWEDDPPLGPRPSPDVIIQETLRLLTTVRPSAPSGP